ncbi:universal stress protein [Halomicrococcus gelatinilyticus]|uniref:universal stress protein n=1 Tax=Halomicrococcus gelatinilyticus TaxID=1702103 RepID=UPI002E0E9F6B
MYDDILIPTDGSDATETAIEHAADVARQRNATVHVLHVIDDRAFLTLDDDRVDQVTEQLRNEGERAVGQAAEQLEDVGVQVTTTIRKGSPADEIVAAAEEKGIDLVVMGTRGPDATENLLGSVAQKVVATASAPVLTVNIAED